MNTSNLPLDVREQFATPPRCVIVVRVDEVFSQCSRAIEQSKLWLGGRER